MRLVCPLCQVVRQSTLCAAGAAAKRIQLNGPGAELHSQIQAFPGTFDGKVKQLHRRFVLHMPCGFAHR